MIPLPTFDQCMAALCALLLAAVLYAVVHRPEPPTVALDPVQATHASCEEVSRMPSADPARHIVILVCEEPTP